MQSAFIATPCYDGTVTTGFTASLLQTIDACRAQGIPVRWDRWDGCCYLPIARNKLVKAFLDSDCTDLIWIDADMVWQPDGVLKLLRHDRDIVGGAHPYKSDTADTFPVRVKTEADGRPKVDPYTGLIEADGLPTSFLRIKRGVFETIAKAEGEPLEVHEYGRPGELIGKYVNFFDCRHENNLWWGEDYAFCRLAVKHGFKLWVEPDITFGHIGSKVWVGNYHQYLRNLPGGGGEKPADWKF